MAEEIEQLPTPERADIDYMCMYDGKVYAGPDAGDVVPKPPKRELRYRDQVFYTYDWPYKWKGHYISHGSCPEHTAQGLEP